jgi:hypothetical protein
VPFDRARQCGWDGLLFVQFGLLQVESCPIFDPELYEKMNRQRVIQGKNENNNTGTLLDLEIITTALACRPVVKTAEGVRTVIDC